MHNSTIRDVQKLLNYEKSGLIWKQLYRLKSKLKDTWFKTTLSGDELNNLKVEINLLFWFYGAINRAKCNVDLTEISQTAQEDINKLKIAKESLNFITQKDLLNGLLSTHKYFYSRKNLRHG